MRNHIKFQQSKCVPNQPLKAPSLTVSLYANEPDLAGAIRRVFDIATRAGRQLNINIRPAAC